MRKVRNIIQQSLIREHISYHGMLQKMLERLHVWFYIVIKFYFVCPNANVPQYEHKQLLSVYYLQAQTNKRIGFTSRSFYNDKITNASIEPKVSSAKKETMNTKETSFILLTIAHYNRQAGNNFSFIDVFYMFNRIRLILSVFALYEETRSKHVFNALLTLISIAGLTYRRIQKGGKQKTKKE